MTTPVLANDTAFELGEGPVWDADSGRVLWVDILTGRVLEGTLTDGRLDVRERETFDGMVGAVALAQDGGLLVAGQEQLVHVTADGTRIAGPQLIPSGAGRSLNDGKVDPAGRYLVGTLTVGKRTSTESLVRLEPDGSITTLDDDLTLSNGLAWSVDGSRLYSADSYRQAVFVRDYDPAGTEIGTRAVHLEIEGGLPDGLAMDSEDHLWVAVWGAGEVRRYSPAGQLVQTVSFPAPHTSCIAFAGDDLRTAVVTTATDELDDAQLREYPQSGCLFTFTVDAPGVPVPRWSGANF